MFVNFMNILIPKLWILQYFLNVPKSNEVDLKFAFDLLFERKIIFLEVYFLMSRFGQVCKCFIIDDMCNVLFKIVSGRI